MMNREQAGHLLDAYAKANNKDAKDTLREVILDAMTEVRYQPYYYPYWYQYPYKATPNTTPNITWTCDTGGTPVNCLKYDKNTNSVSLGNVGQPEQGE